MSGKTNVKIIGDQFLSILDPRDDHLNVFYYKYRMYRTKLLEFYKVMKSFGQIMKSTEMMDIADENLMKIEGLFWIEFPMDPVFETFDFRIEGQPVTQKIIKKIRHANEELTWCGSTAVLCDVIGSCDNYRDFISTKGAKRYERLPIDINAKFDNYFKDAPGQQVELCTNSMNVNLWDLWVDTDKKLFFCYLQKLIISGFEAYRALLIPDIDPGLIMTVMESALSRSEKESELRNCEKGFKMLKGSLNLLYKNFDIYYENYIKTHNKFIIFEMFFQDILTDSKSGSEDTKQLSQIMKFFTKKSQTHNLPFNTEFISAINDLDKKMTVRD